MPSSLNRQKIIIAGGSGFVGTSLAHHLAGQGADVVILARKAPLIVGRWRYAQWDGRTLGPWSTELEGAAGLVNLAGRSVNCVKTPDHQDEILRSRVESTRVLGEAVRSVDGPPPVWVQMSTAHIYGDPPDLVCSEASSCGYGLAPAVGKAWEEAYSRSILTTQRAVVLRTSFVLGRNRGAGGGALDLLGPLARVGLGGRVGRGTQGMSWIHEFDLSRLIEWCLVDSKTCGTYVATAPQPVSNSEFMRELRRAVGMPIGMPAASWMVRFAARYLLRTDPELALYGRYVISRRLDSEGFSFQFPTLRHALDDVLSRTPISISATAS